MKKQVISIVTAVILGIPNPAKAFNFTFTPSWNWGSNPPKPVTPQHYLDIIELLKKQLAQAKKTYSAIGHSKSKDVQTDYTSFFLKDPQLIYDENNNLAVSTRLQDILSKEEIPTSVRASRDTIVKRMQYATVADRAVSLQTFKENDLRFKQISELVKQINKTADLKSIAELQARIQGMLTMIQNETAKLQMVAHSRNAEQAFINQQKQKRNMKIFNSENKGMPIIQSIR
ncbi:type IV secretion system protein [Bartonella florencae]|uniref:type IV secretion system protein n=1 Tax=Bartonella florencae TaxID=928210 RepID=UPI00030C9D9E|nr:type IV secretion system protein [Bartonella florencae]